MRFLRRHWYNVGVVVAAFAIAIAVLGNLRTVQVILLLNFAVLTLHQFEELGWPGGFPWMYNEVVNARGGPADRYPLNQNNNLFINVWAAYPFCLLPVFFPNALWLGLAMVLFGVAQFFIHGFVNNLKLKTIYNPGFATVVFGFLPLGAWYLFELYSHQTVPWWNWLIAAACVGFFSGVVMVRIGFGLLADKNSPYPFEPKEMERFDRRSHLARLGIVAIAGMPAADIGPDRFGDGEGPVGVLP
jgi:hypothetical protein